MKKILVFLFLCLFVFVGFAQARDNRRDYRKYDNRRDYRSYHRRDVNWEHVGAAGAILGGAIILDRILPPRQVIVRQHYCSPPPVRYYPPPPVRYQQPSYYPPQPAPRVVYPRQTIPLTPEQIRAEEHEEALIAYEECLSERQVDLDYGVPANRARDCSRLNPQNQNWKQ